VNFILHEHHGARIAVILNEFGDELGIEKAMVNDGAGGSLVEEWVELANGCVCCSVKHSFLQAIEQLLQRREKYARLSLCLSPPKWSLSLSLSASLTELHFNGRFRDHQ
jgi:G3E family GTPase